jgi:hypothetical protein
MPPVGFETTISADKRPQTHALGRAATRTDIRSVSIKTAEIFIVRDNKPEGCALSHCYTQIICGDQVFLRAQ